MTYELHIIDPKGNRVKFATDTKAGVRSMCHLMMGLGDNND